MYDRLLPNFDRFIDVGTTSDFDVAALARDLKIDIAMDLLGYTTDNRPGIFALRAAPVQASYIGYPGTMGTTAIDYILADRVVIPPHHRQHYDEKICFLPNSYQANDSKRVISDTPFTRQQMGLPETGFVFCCFNQHYKFTPDVFDSWMNILRRVDNSVLWLNVANPTARTNLHAEAQKRNIPRERIIFADTIGFSDHLARQRLADLFLDTFHYGAHGTASHALWAGLPILTKLGDTFAGRVAASLLQAIGLPELIVESVTQYENLAVAIAAEPGKAAHLKQRLAANSKSYPLFDTQRFTRNLEEAYRRMLERHHSGTAPEDMDVPDQG
jgi:predicted O-linked N-acetylglucosamine transferase (SPINDLY family)